MHISALEQVRDVTGGPAFHTYPVLGLISAHACMKLLEQMRGQQRLHVYPLYHQIPLNKEKVW